MNSVVLSQLAVFLGFIRYGASEQAFAHYMRFTGYVDGLRDAGAVDPDVLSRVNALGLNAFNQIHGRQREVRA